jgi:hypothetical protein
MFPIAYTVGADFRPDRTSTMTSEFSLSASAGGDPDTHTASPYPVHAPAY